MKDHSRASCHAGHRERLRSELLRYGGSSFSDQKLLEVLLYYTIPMGDTSPTAVALCNTFGTLQDVLDAPMEALMQVDGVGRYTAAFLKLLPQIIQRYTSAQMQCGSFSCTDRVAIRQYLSAQYIGATNEQMCLLAFNARGEFTRCVSLASGEDNAHVDLTGRRLAQAVIESAASTVILSHFHPGGVAAPSADDVHSTRAARDVLLSMDVHLQDHVIFSEENDCIFLSDVEGFRSLFF